MDGYKGEILKRPSPLCVPLTFHGPANTFFYQAFAFLSLCQLPSSPFEVPNLYPQHCLLLQLKMVLRSREFRLFFGELVFWSLHAHMLLSFVIFLLLIYLMVIAFLDQP